MSPSLSPPALASPASARHSASTTLTTATTEPLTDKATLKLQKRTQLATIKQQVIQEMVDAEFHEKKKKLEAMDNKVRNAMKHAPGSANTYYDVEAEGNKLKAALLAQLTRQRPASADTKVRLVEPHTVVSWLLHTCSMGKSAVIAFLRDVNNVRELCGLSMKDVQASLICYVERVQSPTHYKCEMLWRLAVIGEGWEASSEYCYVCWKLSQKCYQILLDKCDGKRHAWQYAAFSIGLARVEEQLEELTMVQLMERGNRSFVFVPPDWADGSAMFFFQS